MSRRTNSLALLLLGACAVAIWLQDHSDALPLGLFNEGRETYAWLSHAALLGVFAAALVLGAEVVRGRPLRGAAALRGGLAAALLLELGVSAIDCGLVSRSPDSRLGGPYWERSGPGGPVFLKKGAAPFGFRSPEPYAPRNEHPRVLFLGDSYVEGSGSDFACNYPQVAEAELSRRLGRRIQVMNAGVAGYGPVESAHLLDLLVAEGFDFDTVVYHLFLENDFTDNLPGTERRVVAGINFRFPASRFLRTFHPLNTRTFRYGVFVATASRLTRPERSAAARGERHCRLDEERLEAVTPELRRLVMRRLAANYGSAPRLATGEVGSAIARMAAVARERAVPFVLVVFPDRILADPELRSLLSLDESAWQLSRLVSWVTRELAVETRIDLTNSLGGSIWYRKEDTHLSDLGNLRAGRLVAKRLAPQLRNALE